MRGMQPTFKIGVWKSQLVEVTVLRSHDPSCYLSCDHTTRLTTGRKVVRLVARLVVRLESVTITHDRAKPPATDRAMIVLLRKTYVRPPTI